MTDTNSELAVLACGRSATPDASARILKPLAIALLATLLGACSILGGSEPIRIIDPTPRIQPASDLPQARWSLLVMRPIAGQSLDTERIVVRPAPGAMQVYKGAAWPDTAPDLVQTALVRAFEDSGRILSVARPGGAVRGDFQLTSELRAFESVYEGANPTAVIELHARLVRVSNGEAVAARTFRASEPAQGVEVEAIGEAFSRGLAKVGGDAVAWTLTEGNRAGLRE
jgi:cholesterol transport system auxiliary component